jgi:short-subunit dehydrogenase
MLKRGRGHIVNISSLAGSLAMPGMVGYSASKAALAHFTAALRADLHGSPIGTTLVEIGAISGGMPGAGFGPTVDAVGRLSRARLLGGVSREEVTTAVVAAVRANRRHVRLPKHAAVGPMLVEAPRRVSELLITGLPHRRGV